MKKTIKLALAASMILGATSAFATNGSNLIGVGGKARGMGGASIGVSHGAESALANPALISSIEGTEVSFGGTVFMPSVSNTNGVNLTAAPGGKDDSSSADSAADMNVIPSVSIASKINDNFYWGIGMWGTAGMGVDYRGTENTGQLQMVTNLQLMQFGVPLVYSTNNFSVGITPVLQYGSLDINYARTANLNSVMQQTPTAADEVGEGVSQDLQMGFNLGVAYEIAGVTIGASYKSQIDMEYKGQLTSAIQGFGVASYDNDKLSTPAEIGFGVSYNMDEHTIAFDYKMIQWADAEGYKDFEWENQNAIALGYEYATKGWAARVGYNYASSPISDQEPTFNAQGQDTSTANSAGLNGSTVNTFNLLGFPGIVESHITLGGTYNFSKQTSLDVAYVAALEASNTFKNFAAQDIETTHSQNAVTFQLNYNF